MQNLKRRFGDTNVVMMRGATLLCPSSSSTLDENSLVAFENMLNETRRLLRRSLRLPRRKSAQGGLSSKK